MLPVLEVPGQLPGGLQLLSGVLLKDGSPSLNVACVEAPGQFPGVCSCWHVCFLNDDCPSLNVACVGSVRTTTGGLQLLSCVFFER